MESPDATSQAHSAGSADSGAQEQERTGMKAGARRIDCTPEPAARENGRLRARRGARPSAGDDEPEPPR